MPDLVLYFFERVVDARVHMYSFIGPYFLRIVSIYNFCWPKYFGRWGFGFSRTDRRCLPLEAMEPSRLIYYLQVTSPAPLPLTHRYTTSSLSHLFFLIAYSFSIPFHRAFHIFHCFHCRFFRYPFDRCFYKLFLFSFFSCRVHSSLGTGFKSKKGEKRGARTAREPIFLAFTLKNVESLFSCWFIHGRKSCLCKVRLLCTCMYVLCV